MIKTSMLSATISAVLFLSSTASAQAPQMPKQDYYSAPSMGGPMKHHGMKPPRFTPPPPPPKMKMPNFPSAAELARMAPPEPMTEEKIKARFAKRKAALNEVMDRDRKAAEKYAQDFARLQKYQADRLAEIMSKAEKQREARLKRLDEQEQKMLERFRQSQSAKAAKTPAVQ